MTRTHTHTVTLYANPYLRCDECNVYVDGFLVGPPNGCEHEWRNHPCEHLGITSECPSWSPVDGCECVAHLGYKPHGEPPERDEWR